MFKNLEFENSMKIKKLKLKINQKGFTLIELLVVIALIGILASFAIASFTSAQAKGRDSRRKADLDAIKKALELYRGDQTAGTVPNAIYGGELTTPDYIKTIPVDPKNNSPYFYSASGGFKDYTLRACAENDNDPQATGPTWVLCVLGGINSTQKTFEVKSP